MGKQIILIDRLPCLYSQTFKSHETLYKIARLVPFSRAAAIAFFPRRFIKDGMVGR